MLFDSQYLKYIIIYFFISSIVGFSLMGIDKSRAKRGAWRIKEASLFLVALIGGAFGTTLGMYVFRHKTKHWYFVVFMPLILFMEVALIVLFI